MKGPGEHQVVIACELAHACVELAVVNETARLADYEEREDDPGIVSDWVKLRTGNIHCNALRY